MKAALTDNNDVNCVVLLMAVVWMQILSKHWQGSWKQKNCKVVPVWILSCNVIPKNNACCLHICMGRTRKTLGLLIPEGSLLPLVDWAVTVYWVYMAIIRERGCGGVQLSSCVKPPQTVSFRVIHQYYFHVFKIPPKNSIFVWKMIGTTIMPCILTFLPCMSFSNDSVLKLSVDLGIFLSEKRNRRMTCIYCSHSKVQQLNLKSLSLITINE